jgi:exonuclease SbcC
VLITRVELENIKSYRQGAVRLQPGATAISGANGAGKTTLVEAIGFALFDALPYAQAQFVRENERTGMITVTFISDLDGREYQVARRCGANALWYVYDPQIGQRLVEQKADVLDWLRHHMRIESDLKLDYLFSNALGVPQGTFTTDFLQPPAQRKQKFDALLQVDDYRRAADKLRDTHHYLVDRIHEAEVRITGLSRDTQYLETWRQERQKLQAQEHAKAGELLQKQDDFQRIDAHRAVLAQQEAKVARLDNDRAMAHASWVTAMQLAELASSKLHAAEQAVQTAVATEEDYRRFNESEAALREARRRQEARAAIEKQRVAHQRDLDRAEQEIVSAETALQEAQDAAAEVAALAPQVAEQERLERELQEAHTAQEQLRRVKKSLAELDREIRQLEASLADREARLAAIKAHAAEANLLPERRQTVERLSQAMTTRSERTRRAAAARKELQEATAQEERARNNVAKAEAYITKVQANLGRAAELPTLEARLRDVQTTVVALRADIKQHEQSRVQSAGGQCPFLREPCLNIKQRGQSSLEDYFARLISDAEAQLDPLVVQETSLAEEVRQCSSIKRDADRLGEYEEILAQRREELAAAGMRRAALETELTELETWLAEYETIEQELARAQEDYRRSDDADRQMRQLPGLESERRNIAERLEACAQQHASAVVEQERFHAVAARLPEIQQALAALADPRSRRANREGIAARASSAAQRLECAQANRQGAEELLREVAAQLAPFAGLDEQVAALEAELARCRLGHDTHLKCEQIAAGYPAAQAEHACAQAAERQAHAAFDAAHAAWEAATANFDPAALQAASAQVNMLREEISTLTEAIHGLHARIAERDDAIAHASALLAELAAARREYDQLVELREGLHLFRETMKEAGPYVMRARLRQISAEANRIFGEIFGDRSARLSWEEDYEIVLRHQGITRHFAQLSGGEQMSAAIAVRLALLKTLTGLDIAFFDEPTQNMDEQRRMNLAAQIRRVRGFQQILVISHDDTFEQGLDSIIRLRKEDGQTRVESDALAANG